MKKLWVLKEKYKMEYFSSVIITLVITIILNMNLDKLMLFDDEHMLSNEIYTVILGVCALIFMIFIIASIVYVPLKMCSKYMYILDNKTRYVIRPVSIKQEFDKCIKIGFISSIIDLLIIFTLGSEVVKLLIEKVIIQNMDYMRFGFVFSITGLICMIISMGIHVLIRKNINKNKFYSKMSDKYKQSDAESVLNVFVKLMVVYTLPLVILEIFSSELIFRILPIFLGVNLILIIITSIYVRNNIDKIDIV